MRNSLKNFLKNEKTFAGGMLLFGVVSVSIAIAEKDPIYLLGVLGAAALWFISGLIRKDKGVGDGKIED
jgi:hypothetical protein